MSRFKVEERNFGKFSTIKVFDDFLESSIEIAQMGATLLSYEVKTNRGFLGLIDGFADDAEMESGTAYRSWIMAPYSKFMKDNSYTFQNKTYSFGSVENKLFMNGLVARCNFQVTNLSIEETSVIIDLETDSLITENHQGYPFPVSVKVRYKFEGNALGLTISGTNKGDKDAPFACGWHPYLRISEKSGDSAQLSIPAERLVMTDFNFVPFKGVMTFTHLSNLPGSDFRPVVYSKKRVLGRRILNMCYSHLIPSIDGMIITRMENPELNISLALKQKSGVLYAYTGDDLGLRQRQSIAFQPASNVTDAFNRSDIEEDITLRPGTTKEFPIELEFIQN